MEFKYGNLVFSSNFDSGNLLNVERIISNEDHSFNQSDSNKPDYEFNVWTKPDCYGTEFENGNRTWFYFSVKGYLPNRTIKITIKNLNRQQRLYSQGYCPLFKTETLNGENKWFRVRFRPTWETNENNFQLTFMHRFSEIKNSTTYFAFCYPWSYKDCQKQLEDLDNRFAVVRSSSIDQLSKMDPGTIYYNRELLTRSLDGRRIDLLTISDLNGLTNEYEDIFDEKLFPESICRPCKFSNKKVFVVTSRVHPGETPASHVFNGFLEFILREDDVRSIQLRKQFIFKLIPLLNPDGVYHGHYRTDTRGVNLNRVYLYPDIKTHPSIYAAKSLLVYHHIVNSSESNVFVNAVKQNVFGNINPPNYENDKISLNDNESIPENGEYQINSNIRNTEEIEFPLCEKLISNSIETHFKVQPELTLPPLQVDLNIEKRLVDSRSINDFLEVTVDIENSLSDPLSNKTIINLSESKMVNEFHLANNQNEISITSNERENMSNQIHDSSVNNLKSVYKLTKLPGKRSGILSKSNDSIMKPTTEHHHWNLKNFKVPQETNVLQQLSKPYKKLSASMIPLPLRPAIVSMKFSSKKMNKITLSSAQLSKMKKELQLRNGFKTEPKIGNEGSDDESERELGNNECLIKYSLHLSDSSLLKISPDNSGIAFYVDLHGHCSKRGCFIYGNCLESESEMIANLLFPKLISLNSPHFDFSGCNFSFKNMYTRDKRDGCSKEGAGRVAMWKHLGIVHSYTLECNYNTGRIINSIPQVLKDNGRTSPPTAEISSCLAPRYTPYHFEDVGKAMAISALDVYKINPLSRLINSEYNNLQTLCDYLRKYLYNQKVGTRQSNSFKNRPIRQTKTQPSNSSFSSNSKQFPSNSDNRRLNSQTSISLNGSRKSQSSVIQRLPSQKGSSNSKLVTKPIFSNEVILNSYQLDMIQKNGDLENKKPNSLSINNQEIEKNNRISPNLNISYSHLKHDQNGRFDENKSFIKRSLSHIDKISCDSANILNKNGSASKELNCDTVNKDCNNSSNNFKIDIPQLQYHVENKTLLPLRRNSISGCYTQNSTNENYFTETEKNIKLEEILNENQLLDEIESYCKAHSFNYGNQVNQIKKTNEKNQKLGKLISYSANDIHY